MSVDDLIGKLDCLANSLYVNPTSTITNQIAQRCSNTNNGNISDINTFNANVKKCKIFSISFEAWIAELKNPAINRFYCDVKKHNKVN
jgi:hypothetical protein